MQSFIRLMDRLSVACAVAGALLLASAVVVITWMVIYREMGNSTDWEIEYAVFAMVGALFLASPYTLMTNGHVAVDLLGHYLPPEHARRLSIATGVLGLLVCAYLTYAGAELTLHAWLSGETTESSWAPVKWPLFLSMPVGLGLTALQYLAEIARAAQQQQSA
jgi:TRAP-type C4-dicarboxylate transport system permease small subunit